MSRPTSVLTLSALLAATLVLAMPSRAEAQACCAGGGAYLPARLKLHEDELVGLQVRATDDLGSLTPSGGHLSNPSGAGEVDLEEDFVGAVRVLGRGQLGFELPFVETQRSASGLSDFGGGLGDASVAFRYDFLYAGESAHVPGLAIGAGLTAPTGRAPEQAHSILLADTTGTGTWQGLITGEVEQVFGPIVLTVDAVLSGSAPRTVGLVREQLGPTVSGFAAAGYVLPHDVAVALVLSTSQSFNAILDGRSVPQSGRGLTTASLAGGLPISSTWRLQGSLNADVPALGRNRPTGLGATFTVVRAWL